MPAKSKPKPAPRGRLGLPLIIGLASKQPNDNELKKRSFGPSGLILTKIAKLPARTWQVRQSVLTLGCGVGIGPIGITLLSSKLLQL